MTSYELANAILELRNDVEEGLIDLETFNDTVEGLCVEDKLNGLIYANKRITSEIELLKEEKARLDKEIKKQEQNKERIQSLVNMLLSATGDRKFEGVAGKISYRKSKSLEVSQDFIESHKNEDYIIEDIKYKVDKKALKSLVEAYGDIEGVIVIEKDNLQIK